MGTDPIGKLLLKMALPIMLSMLIQGCYNLVDSMFVAAISPDALAAVTLAQPLQVLIVGFAVGTGVGVNALLAKRLGEKDRDAASKIAGHGITLAIITWAVFILIGVFFSERFMLMFTDDPYLVEQGSTYLFICLTVSGGVFLGIMGERILFGTGNTIRPMFATILGAVINIALDPIFIFGYFGVPAMGVKGAAIATVISQVISAILSLYFVKKCKEVDVTLKNMKLEGKIVLNIYKIAIPTILMETVNIFTMSIINKVLSGYRNTALIAAYGAYCKLEVFVFMPLWGLTNAMVPIIAYNYGAKEPVRMKKALLYSLLMASCIMVAGFLLFQIFPEFLLTTLFNATEEMVILGSPIFRRISISFITAIFSIILGSFFQSLGNGLYSMIISLIRQVIGIIPIILILDHFFGINTAWYCFILSDITAVTVAFIMFKSEYKKKVKPLQIEKLAN